MFQTTCFGLLFLYISTFQYFSPFCFKLLLHNCFCLIAVDTGMLKRIETDLLAAGWNGIIRWTIQGLIWNLDYPSGTAYTKIQDWIPGMNINLSKSLIRLNTIYNVLENATGLKIVASESKFDINFHSRVQMCEWQLKFKISPKIEDLSMPSCPCGLVAFSEGQISVF